jgi:co-chaperonin GroES (HSP10)
MKAQGEHVLIRKPNRKKALDSGIILPDANEQTYFYGRVLSVGPKVSDLGVSVKEGDIVVYDKHGAVAVELDPMKDGDLDMAHGTQVFLTLVEEQLEKRKLPIP